MNKETVVALIQKEEIEFFKDDDGFAEHIVKQLSQGLSDKLITILDKENEVIVRQSNVRVSEYMPTNSVEYRRQIEWSPLVRCKECEHRYDDGMCCGRGVPIQLVPDDGFCDKGKRREDGESIS